jgi:hypothetical protein
MMMTFDKKYEKRPGDGSAFVNVDKTEDWHFPYTGEIMLPDGTTHYVNIKPGKTKAGQHWFQIKIGKPKTKREDNQGDNAGDNPKATVTPIFKSNDSDIPF